MSLAVALTHLALDRRLTWSEVANLLDVEDRDVEQAAAEVEFDAWWNSRVFATRRLMWIHELLAAPAPDPDRRFGWAESRQRLLSDANHE